jgi:flagellar operon protein
MSDLNKIHWPLRPATSAPSTPTNGAPAKAHTDGREGFDTLLQREVQGAQPLSFSSHAQARLISRQIQLSDTQIARLQRGVDQAAQKGGKDSLVMLDNLAFIVSVGNRKIVTALDGAAQSGNVFTQIDSAVIV